MKREARYRCSKHGCDLVLVRHELSTEGRKLSGIGFVTFFRCPFIYENGSQCVTMKPNKWQHNKPVGSGKMKMEYRKYIHVDNHR
jgi:hypothetical protein